MGANLAPEVFKNKECVMGKNFPWTDEVIKELKKQDILSKKEWDEIEKQKFKKDKKSMFVEKLISTIKSEKDFNKLCDFLDTHEAWLCDELRYELASAKKTEEPEDGTNKEVDMIVFREFGAEKKLSEGEKKGLNDVMRYKTQCTKNIWRNQVDRNKKNTKDLEDRVKYADDTAETACDEIETFVNENRTRLKSRNFGRTSKSTSDLFADKKKKKAPLDNLDFHVDVLIDMATQSMMEREHIVKEKNKGLKHLGCEDDQKEIDAVVKDHLANSAKKQLGLRMTRDEKDREIEDLYLTIDNIKDHRERKLREKNRELHELNTKVIEEESELKAKTGEMEQLLRQLNEAKDELEEHKERKESLAKGKRVQTIYSRDGEKNGDAEHAAIASEIKEKKNDSKDEKQEAPAERKQGKKAEQKAAKGNSANSRPKASGSGSKSGSKAGGTKKKK